MNYLLAFFIIFFIVWGVSQYDVKLNFVLGLAISLALVYYLNSSSVTREQLTNDGIYEKLNNLLKNENLPPPDYFFMDANIILIYDEIKRNLQEYNRDAFVRSINSANNVLKLTYYASLNDLVLPLKTGTLESFESSIFSSWDANREKDIKVGLNNLSDIYEYAELNIEKTIEYTRAFELVVPVEYKNWLNTTIKRLHIQLKRNTDKIKMIINEQHNNDNINKNTSFVTDYDSPVSYLRYNS